MRSVYICQLSQEKQNEIRKMLTGLLLHGSGGNSNAVKHFYGVSLDEAVQNGMDSKIVDLDYLMTYYADEFQTEQADKEFRMADATVISGILKEARQNDQVPDFYYPEGRCEDYLSQQEEEWER
ncbi:hypothetical protein [Lacrimispora brassicae]